MGTHPIFESDFDCLTEIGQERERDAMLLLYNVIIVVVVLSQEDCIAPNDVAGITYLCDDGRCVSICDGDLAWPIDAPASFECADYPGGDYPFATLCGQPCQPPQPGSSLQQECTETHCSYTCDNGQFLTGPSDVYCNLQREWGSDLPVCHHQKQY